MTTTTLDDLGDNWRNVIISEATLRATDLIVAMVDVLTKSSARNERYFQEVIVPEWSDVIGMINSEDKTDDDHEAEGQLLDHLHNLLNTIAPAGCYFGATEGDGACIGFFPNDDLEIN